MTETTVSHSASELSCVTAREMSAFSVSMSLTLLPRSFASMTFEMPKPDGMRSGLAAVCFSTSNGKCFFLPHHNSPCCVCGKSLRCTSVKSHPFGCLDPRAASRRSWNVMVSESHVSAVNSFVSCACCGGAAYGLLSTLSTGVLLGPTRVTSHQS